MAFDYTTYISRIRLLLMDTTTNIFSDADIQSWIDLKALTVYRASMFMVNTRLWKTSVPNWLDDGTLSDITIRDGINYDATTITPASFDVLKGVATFNTDQHYPLFIEGTAFNLYEVVANLMLSYLTNYKHDYNFSDAGSYSPTSRRDTYTQLYQKYMNDAAYWSLTDNYVEPRQWPYDIDVWGYWSNYRNYY